MSQTAVPDTEFTAMLRLEEVIKDLTQPDGRKLKFVSTGKSEPDDDEFYAGYYVDDHDSLTDMQGPALSATRVQLVAFARSQRRAFDLAVLARETLEGESFERVGNASVITRDKRIGVTRDFEYTR